MSAETLARLPLSLQIWQKIEDEAQRRAESRLRDIIKGRSAEEK